MNVSGSNFLCWLKRLNRKRNRYIHDLKSRLRLLLAAWPLPAANSHPLHLQPPQRIIFPFVNLGIGDAVCHTGLWRRLKALGYRVQIITEPRSEAFFKGIDCIDEVFIVDIHHIDQLAKIDSDIVVAIYSWMERKALFEIKLLSRIRYKCAISVGGWLKRPYHITLDLDANFHITDAQKRLLAMLGQPCPALRYWLTTRADSDDFIKHYLEKHTGKPRIVLNPFASVDERTMTAAQLTDLIAKLQQSTECHIFIIGEAHQLARIKNVDNVFICDFNSLWHAISLIDQADLVISVETSVVHIACALNKKLVSIFYSTNIDYNNALQSNVIFKPIGEKAQQIIVNGTTLPFNTDNILQASLAMLAAGAPPAVDFVHGSPEPVA